jgi:hypothetical protein
MDAQCVKRLINLGGPLARIRLSDPGVKERLQDLLIDAYLIAHVPVAMQTDRDAERAAARQWLGTSSRLPLYAPHVRRRRVSDRDGWHDAECALRRAGRIQGTDEATEEVGCSGPRMKRLYIF